MVKEVRFSGETWLDKVNRRKRWLLVLIAVVMLVALGVGYLLYLVALAGFSSVPLEIPFIASVDGSPSVATVMAEAQVVDYFLYDFWSASSYDQDFYLDIGPSTRVLVSFGCLHNKRCARLCGQDPGFSPMCVEIPMGFITPEVLHHPRIYKFGDLEAKDGLLVGTLVTDAEARDNTAKNVGFLVACAGFFVVMVLGIVGCGNFVYKRG